MASVPPNLKQYHCVRRLLWEGCYQRWVRLPWCNGMYIPASPPLPSLPSLSPSFPYPVSPHIPQPKSGGFKFTVELKGCISNGMCFVSTKCKVCVHACVRACVWVCAGGAYGSNAYMHLPEEGTLELGWFLFHFMHVQRSFFFLPNRYKWLDRLQVLNCVFHQVWNCLSAYVVHYRVRTQRQNSLAGNTGLWTKVCSTQTNICQAVLCYSSSIWNTGGR